MNIIAVDICNTNITVPLYLKDEEQFTKSVSERSRAKLTEIFKYACDKIPVANKIDLDPDGKIVEELRKGLDETIYPISKVTGYGIKQKVSAKFLHNKRTAV
jgi:50S ribosomal subunit-associated GTPase HflX